MNDFELQDFDIQQRIIMRSNAKDAIEGLGRLQEKLEEHDESTAAKEMEEFADKLAESFEIEDEDN